MGGQTRQRALFLVNPLARLPKRNALQSTQSQRHKTAKEMADVEMAEASVPGEEEVVAPKKVITQAFSAELLSLYYSRLFPYDEMYRWLSYGNNLTDKSATGTTVGNPEYFYHREISFTLEDDIYIRYLNFRNASEFRKEITKKQPHKKHSKIFLFRRIIKVACRVGCNTSSGESGDQSRIFGARNFGARIFGAQ